MTSLSLQNLLIPLAENYLAQEHISTKEVKIGRPLTLQEKRSIYGPDLWNQLTSPQQHSLLCHLAPQSVDRSDIETRVCDGAREWRVIHEFHHDSPLNGKSFYDSSGKRVHISSAIGDQMTRCISQNNCSIAYAGRTPATQEEAHWIFRQEIKRVGGKGIEFTGESDEERRPICRLTYFSPSSIAHSAIIDGYKVVFNPLKNAQQLRTYAQNYRKSTTDLVRQNVDQALEQTRYFQWLSPEKKILGLAHLAQTCHLPITIQCQSGLDNTGIGVALISAFEQFKSAGYYVDMDSLLSNEAFKELVLSNLMVGHHITNFGRGAQGEIGGEELQECFGYEIQNNPMLRRLLPERYLEKQNPLVLLSFPLIVIGSLCVAIAAVFLALIQSIRAATPLPLIRYLIYGWIITAVQWAIATLRIVRTRKLLGVPDFQMKTPERKLAHHLRAQIAKLESLDYNKMIRLFKTHAPIASELSEDEKASIIGLCAQRDELKTLLQIKPLAAQISKKARELIEAALQWPILHFDTASTQTQQDIIAFFESGGVWKVPVPSHEIENQWAPYLNNEQELASQFNKDTQRDNQVFIEGRETKTFEIARNELLNKGLSSQEALRILSCCQQGGHSQSLLATYTLLTHFDTRGRFPDGGVNLVKEGNLRAEVSSDKIILTCPYVVTGTDKKFIFTNRLDIATDTAEAEFQIVRNLEGTPEH